jgi:glycosyltransferase involved in cell wall biosynthesis
MRVLAVTNIYPTPKDAARGTFVEQQVKGLRSVGVEVEVLYVNRVRSGAAAYIGVQERVKRSLSAFDADIVHVMYGGVMAWLVTKTVRARPTIVTFHGSDLLGETLAGPWRQMIAGLGVRCSRQSAHRASGVVVVSPALRDVLPATVSRSRIRVIPCGIDVNRFIPLDRQECRRQLGWSNDRMVVLFNSNGGDPVKRPALAYAAVEALQRAGVPAELRELRDRPYAEMPTFLNAGDVLLLTSRHEGSPTIVKEALACNVPVVSVDVGDVRQRIEGIAGCYLAEPDAQDLGAKLRMVAEGPRRIEGRSGIASLSIESVAQELRAFYGEVCDASSHVAANGLAS